MPPPLAFLNDEEVHWQSDLGLPNQRRWLNHRNVGDEHRRKFPSAATDINTDAQVQETGSFFSITKLCEERKPQTLQMDADQNRERL